MFEGSGDSIDTPVKGTASSLNVILSSEEHAVSFCF